MHTDVKEPAKLSVRFNWCKSVWGCWHGAGSAPLASVVQSHRARGEPAGGLGSATERRHGAWSSRWWFEGVYKKKSKRERLAASPALQAISQMGRERAAGAGGRNRLAFVGTVVWRPAHTASVYKLLFNSL